MTRFSPEIDEQFYIRHTTYTAVVDTFVNVSIMIGVGNGLIFLTYMLHA